MKYGLRSHHQGSGSYSIMAQVIAIGHVLSEITKNAPANL